MLPISVQNNVGIIAGNVADMKREFRVKVADTISRVIRTARTDLQQVVRTSFDRPTPYTVNSIYTKAANATTLEATIRFKDDGSGGLPASYLLPQVEGGGRPLKRGEYLLQARGILPQGMYAVPGEGAQLDAYGNMSRGQIVQILAYFETFGTNGFASNSTDASRARLAKGTRQKRGIEYFVMSSPSGPKGIYSRTTFGFGSAIKPVLMFVKAPQYEKRLPYTETVQRTVERDFDRELTADLATLPAP